MNVTSAMLLVQYTALWDNCEQTLPVIWTQHMHKESTDHDLRILTPAEECWFCLPDREAWLHHSCGINGDQPCLLSSSVRHHGVTFKLWITFVRALLTLLYYSSTCAKKYAYKVVYTGSRVHHVYMCIRVHTTFSDFSRIVKMNNNI